MIFRVVSSDLLIGDPLRSLQVPRRARRGTEGGRAAVLRAAGARPPGHAGRREGRRPARQPGKGKCNRTKGRMMGELGERLRTQAPPFYGNPQGRNISTSGFSVNRGELVYAVFHPIKMRGSCHTSFAFVHWERKEVTRPTTKPANQQGGKL